MPTNRARIVTEVPGPRSRTLYEHETAHLGNGLQSIALYSQIAIDHGEGSILVDVDGNRYIDYRPASAWHRWGTGIRLT